MTVEWNDKNWFNSFNSAKGLLYADWYRAILKKEFKPPIEASLDPIHACNLSCDFCNAARYLRKNKNPDKMYRIPDDHLIKLIDFLADWGVLSICAGGGGEPILHSKLPDALRHIKKRNMDASVATNGSLFNDNIISAMVDCCRWVGVSVDAATKETYKKLRGKDCFDDAIKNINVLSKQIIKQNSKCDVSFKFLINAENQHEIFDACKIASNLGCKDFHARAADINHQGCDTNQEWKSLDISSILSQFEKCRELEREDFRIFTVVHKFDKNFKPKKDFSNCYAAPICIQICADGFSYNCVDQRQQEKYRLCSHYPDPKNILNFWGKEKHKEFVFGNIPKICNTRCTFVSYHKQVEELFVKETDPMCWKFT